MKIRWMAGSIRFRISPSELSALMRGEAVMEAIHLTGKKVWSACVRPHGEPSRMEACDSEIVLYLSERDCQRLSQPDAEGVYFCDEAGLRFYIEKDFPCIHPRSLEAGEPEQETFAPPDGFAEKTKGKAAK